MSDGGDRRVPRARLNQTPEPARVEPPDEPPPTYAGREARWVADHDPASRDDAPAIGTPGEPAGWERAEPGADVALQRGGWADAAWSYLYKDDTAYGAPPLAPDELAQRNLRMRTGPLPPVSGPVIKPAVWTWEVPLYFWVGGMASGAAFIALACDLAGDRHSAAIARRVSLVAVIPAPPLLISDLGRPERFLNMMRIFKPRSPMNLGAWCLVGFSALAAGAVGADLLDAPRAARVLNAGSAVAGGYLGSYTGVLLATTAVPVWNLSSMLLGPIFVTTALGTGAAATRLTLAAAGLPEGHPTRTALARVETGAMVVELVLSAINERRLGRPGRAMRTGPPGRLFRTARWLVWSGLGLRAVRGPLGHRVHHIGSVSYLVAAMAFRYAWVSAGRASARDDEAVALTARAAFGDGEPRPDGDGDRLRSSLRTPSSVAGTLGGAYADVVRRASLLAERLLRHRRASP
ncbi:MAG: hypothetical protein JWQ20_695 [Conexibacter sp.]|nr:hypothetical protein [Conexibacter sp.]